MKNSPQFSDEQLNAFIDEQVVTDERDELLRALKSDPLLREEVQQLRQLKELVILAYADIPLPENAIIPETRKVTSWAALATTASVLLILGLLGGMLFNKTDNRTTLAQFGAIEDVNLQEPRASRILLHIDSQDPHRVEAALDAAEQWLKESGQNKRSIKVEILAAADGLNIVRQGTPYQKRLRSIVDKNQNVAIRACGFAMEHRRLKEGRPFELIPEAKEVNAALEQILKRLKEGWLYVRA